jgi:hypothetical protein
MYLSDSEKGKESGDEEEASEDKLEKKRFKPTGPDGLSWGDFRKPTAREQIIIEELGNLQE